MKKLLPCAAALGLAMGWGSAGAVDVYMCAGATTKTMPDNVVVPMWGYALDDNNNLADGCGNPLQVPGPLLNVPVGDTSLVVHLRNDLPVATSLAIPGQAGAMTPTFILDPQGRERMVSMTHETAPKGRGVYTWNNVLPGSYVYHSGTHMAVQVQMGLYGGMRKDHAVGMAYDGVPYSQEVNLFYSEIDPALHRAVSKGRYGTTGPTSTLNYNPKYFLVNGAAYDGLSVPLAAAASGQSTLLRMYNMGLRTIAPTVLNQHLSLVAEDGSAYPYPRQQYSVMLAAGKTQDALFNPASAGVYAVFDRSLNLSNAAVGPGGQYSFLQVADGTGTAVAVNDAYSMAEDGALTINAPGVLSNDNGNGPLSATLFGTVNLGNLALAADGSFTYTPAANFNGVAQFSYRVSDGTGDSAPATVSITVTPVNDAPVTVADNFVAYADTELRVPAPGVMANDYDTDSTNLQVRKTSVTQPANGTLSVRASGRVIYLPNPGFTGTDSFTYKVYDELGKTSNASVVTISVNTAPPAPSNQAPVAANDYYLMQQDTIGRIRVLNNDSDADGTLDPASVTIVTPPAKGGNTAKVSSLGRIVFKPGPGFRGSDVVEYRVSDNVGAVSNIATVRVDVVQ